ncbi:hypothetical protein N7532_011464 [Penicillium argentinense]|uniref:Uncharacterized protein n=1 Tax=Penicillium argentinense TaxID=1131581 RepID=A0A9W9EIP3_9EURO|nr:uncharacterized protein N7532_011464 [Penicillium argentinense]KAJ5082421.1 hypothetical protein N7532_011464 [Penicillium argentinense]
MIDPNYSWPLVLLTDLDESCQTRLIDNTRSTIAKDIQCHSKFYFGEDSQLEITEDKVNIQTWTPPKRLLESIAQQGPNRDSQANIHALAVLAHRSGRSRIIVADEMTKRQLLGAPFRNEGLETKVVTVVAVSTRLVPPTNELYVYARRSFCFHEGPVYRFTSTLDWETREPHNDDQVIDFKSFATSWGPLWEHLNEDQLGKQEGLLLRDPDNGVFAANTGTILGWERYINAVHTALKPHLPTELVDEIRKQVDNFEISMPAWDSPPSEKHMVIFILFDATADELANIHSEIQKAIPASFQGNKRRIMNTDPNGTSDYLMTTYKRIPHMTFELIPWQRHHMFSRRDLAAFWSEYRLWDARCVAREDSFPFLYLTSPYESIDSALFGAMICENEERNDAMALLTGRLKLGSICRSMHRCGDIRWFDATDLEPSDVDRGLGYEEKLRHPDQPFYCDFSVWEPAIFEYRTYPIFLLTHQLSEEDIKRIQQEMRVEVDAHEDPDHWDPDHPNRAVIIPWKNGEGSQVDGKVKDIWDIVRNICTYPTISRALDIEIVCLDRQSAVDSTVLVVRTTQYFVDPFHPLLKHLPYPRLPGFEYTRVPARLAGFMMRTILRDEDEAPGYQWSTYFRPGWPGPEEFPEAYEGLEQLVGENSFP